MTNATSSKIGVLVMAHGTPASPSGIEPFYTRIRRGRPPDAGQLADLVRRYAAIGGTSPLTAVTRAQVAGLAAALDAAEPGRFVVRYGAKHVEPFIEDAASALAAFRPGLVVGLVLAPQRASMGSDEYLGRAAEALARTTAAPPFLAVRQWHDAPGFAELLADRVRRSLAGLDAGPAAGRRVVLFTAHSLPARVVASGDPYPEQVAATAAAVAEAARLDAEGIGWRTAWQSAGLTAEPWLGPHLLEVLAGLPAQGTGAVVVCPAGFVADHLEVLYDLDQEARRAAEARGMVFARTASLNDDPAFLAILASVVESAAGVARDHERLARAPGGQRD